MSNILSSILSPILNLFSIHYYLAYLILFLSSFLETIIIVGFFLYGEIFFLAGGILGGIGDLNIWLVVLVCILGGFLGDTTGYLLGRKLGENFIKKVFTEEKRFLNFKNYLKAKKYFHKYGKKSIFFGRFTGPISCIFPFMAGTLKIKYKDFFKYSTPASIIGISQFLLVGYLAGFSYYLFLPKVEKYVFYIILAIFLVGYVFFKRSRIFYHLDKLILKRIAKFFSKKVKK